MRRFTALLFWLYALIIIQSCTKEFTGGKDTIEYQYSIKNNTEESIILNMYKSDNMLISGLNIEPLKSFNLGDFHLGFCDSLDVTFDDNKFIRLYGLAYLFNNTDITPSFENCFSKYISADEDSKCYVLSIDYKMKSFAK